MATTMKCWFTFQALRKPRATRFLFDIGKRTLLSSSDIRLEHYLRQRLFKIDLLGPIGKTNLIRKLEEVTTPSGARLATCDVIDFIHVAETRQDLMLLERLFKLISKEDVTDLKFFRFGASLIRLYHHLGLSKEAYALYKDPECHHHLNDNTCHKVLMDLLYEHKQYDLVLDVFSGLKTFNVDCATLALGAYYHINSRESYEASQALVKDIRQHYELSRRALMYAALLALNQDPTIALETANLCSENMTILNIKLMCQSKLGNTSEILLKLHDIEKRSQDIKRPLSFRIYKDTMEMIKQAITDSGNPKNQTELANLEQNLAVQGVLSQQIVKSFVDRTIVGSVTYETKKGKQKVKRSTQ